jgi:hypothetical protein
MTRRRGAYLVEYTKLKEEQCQRIHFRDNLRYVNLVAVGVVASWALSEKHHAIAWLLIPWLTSILGWTYLMNAVQVRLIRRYIVERLTPLVSDGDDDGTFGWETYHRDYKDYGVQVAFDEATFAAPGGVALGFFVVGSPHHSLGIWLLVALEALLCLWIASRIYCYGEGRRGVRPRARLRAPRLAADLGH